jgi:hypothetical protein
MDGRPQGQHIKKKLKAKKTNLSPKEKKEKVHARN